MAKITLPVFEVVSNTGKLNIINFLGETKNAPTSSKDYRTIPEATAFALPNNSCPYKPLSISPTGTIGIVCGFMYDKYGGFVVITTNTKSSQAMAESIFRCSWIIKPSFLQRV